jgi:murein DD-endopeptidase MepM/ murein hydrolase activator NlpD
MGKGGTVRIVLSIALILTATAVEAQQDFKYHAPGSLQPVSSGHGRADRTIYVRDLLFPIELAATESVVLNSQVYRPGGMYGGHGGQCSPANYSPPWTDNYCEKRSWRMPLCPAGVGHQGNDIRPVTCRDNYSRVLATEDGVIIDTDTNVSMVKLRGDSGNVYRYLHIHPSSIGVSPGDRVTRGTPLARISNHMNGANQTTYHLHFDIQMRLRSGDGAAVVFVPPYTSLISAYRKLRGLPSLDNDGTLKVDTSREIP